MQTCLITTALQTTAGTTVMKTKPANAGTLTHIYSQELIYVLSVTPNNYLLGPHTLKTFLFFLLFEGLGGG